MNNDVPFRLALRVELHLLSTDEGGRTTPVSSGYRPLCQFTRPDKTVVTVGMCQLELVEVEEVKPGESARGLLKFAPGLEDMVRDLAEVSPDVALTEGARVVGTAHVTAVETNGDE
jgi:translation elongation factor EF-Tu-like GTPase